MEIYLLRHGIAEDPKPGAGDASRPLTAEGKKKLRDVLRVARDAGLAPERILTSPLRRAVETAQIAVEELGHKGKLLQTRALEPGAQPETAWNEIRDHRDAVSLLLVGHEPLFGYLGAYLLGVPGVRIDVKKGSLIRIDVDGLGPVPRGELKWMLTSRLAVGSTKGH